jgi:putative ABC transport system permease protein
LGADARSVFLAVARQGMSLAGIGIVLGIAASLALSSLLQSLLFDVKPTDPLTYLSASAIFALVALLACYIPARRAAKVDPLVALRYE